MTVQYCSIPNVYMSSLLSKNSPPAANISMPDLNSKVNLFGKLLCNTVSLFLRSKTFDGLQERKNKKKFTSNLNIISACSEASAKILAGLMNPPLFRTLQWCVPACLGKPMGQNAGVK